MANIFSFDEFSGPNEKKVAEQLAAELPDDWALICNKQISQGDHSREMDFICVASKTVFVIEEKGWSGAIRGTENGWLVYGELRSNPINQSEMCAKTLAGFLKNRWPQKFGVYGMDLVVGVVLMSSPSATLNLMDPRGRSRVLSLQEAASKLSETDRNRDAPAFGPLQKEIVHALTRLPQRPKNWTQIGDYEIHESLDEQLGCLVFRAQHRDGTKRILKVFYGKDALTDAPSDDSSVRRQYDAQRKLSRDDLCPPVAPYFTWDDGRALVIPFDIPRGISFGKLAISGPAPDQIAPMVINAFDALAKVHTQGVVHRSLRPDRVWWDTTSNKLRFSDFVIAHVDGMETVVERADQFDVDHPYRAAECRIDLSAASPKSDVYSLAATILNWITGETPPADDNWTPGPLIDMRKDLGDEVASQIESALYPALELEPDSRPNAWDIAANFRSFIAMQAEAERKASEESTAGKNDTSAKDKRYEVLQSLGKGGTAETFLARDLVRDELVVLKRLIRPEIHGYLATAEFRALNRLKHPCLPKLIEIYGPEEEFHLKFTYTEGQSLKDAWRSLRGDTSDSKEKLVHRIATDVLDALEYLHQNNTLHRDVTPGNILLPEDDNVRVLLIDLGLASYKSEAISRVGTPLYLAPEIEHASPQWSFACDFYGLGVVLFELLADRLPYKTEGTRRCKDLLIDLPNDDDSISASLCKLLLDKACCPDPSQRFSDAAEMRSAIHGVFSDHKRRLLDAEAEALGVIVAKAESSTTQAFKPERKIEEPKQQINAFVTELRQVFRNSTLGNANNRGMDNAFSRDTYVPTELDGLLLPEIIDGKWKCVALSGNPGDGKTAFLEEVRRALLEKNASELECNPAGWRIQLGNHVFASVYDASESHEELSSDELLKAAIQPLSGRKKPATTFTALLAINDGRLQDLISSNRLSFRWLCDSLRSQMAGEEAGDEVLLIDLKHRAPISADPARSSLFLGLLDAFVEPSNYEICKSCTASRDCPILANAEALRQTGPREQLVELLSGVYFVAERRPTIRDLRSALAWMITGDRGCNEVHANNDADRLVNTRYYNLAFDHLAGEDLVLDAFRGLDPASVPSPRLERRLLRAHAATLFDSSPIRYPSTWDEDGQGIPELKRRYFFEMTSEDCCDLPNPSSLVPSRFLQLFRKLVSGEGELRDVRDRLLTGLQRLDRVPAHAASKGLALRLDSSDESLIVIRQWEADAFELSRPESNNRFLNHLPDYFVLRHVDGWPEMMIGLQMFELLMRAADGTTPDAAEHQSLLMDFQRFRAQLLTSPTHQVVLVTSGGNRSLVQSHSGIIDRKEEALVIHV